MSDPLSLIDKRHIVMFKGKPHPCYPGVLEAAMKAGLRELTVKLLQAPSTDNGGMAICEATAVFASTEGRDRVHAEIGDCDGQNCTPHIAPHRVRMAATRAKGRALRDALGIGVALIEEMAKEAEDDEREAGVARPAANGKPQSAAQAEVRAAADERSAAAGARAGLVANRMDGPPVCTGEGCTAELTRDEILGSAQRGWPPLCKACGSKRKAQERAEAEELRQLEAVSDELGSPA